MTHRDVKIVTSQQPQVSQITIIMWEAAGNTRGTIKCALFSAFMSPVRQDC